ncbi:hypothetical protein TNCV_1048391 [Trichonephila clavipes]|nr:hypothetical protein TNCV_1048391 [Trichonephila clavipes]
MKQKPRGTNCDLNAKALFGADIDYPTASHPAQEDGKGQRAEGKQPEIEFRFPGLRTILFFSISSPTHATSCKGFPDPISCIHERDDLFYQFIDCKTFFPLQVHS